MHSTHYALVRQPPVAVVRFYACCMTSELCLSRRAQQGSAGLSRAQGRLVGAQLVSVSFPQTLPRLSACHDDGFHGSFHLQRQACSLRST